MRIYDSGKSKSSARSQDIEVFTRNANVFGSRLILMAHNWIPHHQPAVLADQQSPKPPKLPRYYVSPNSMPGLVLAANRIRAKRSSFLALQLFLIVLLTEFGIVYGDARLPTSGDGPLEFSDILPENPKEYDKMQPPKENGRPTTVLFHVTVMSLDSIDESSMTYAADIFFGQNWKDHRLRLPDNMTSEYRLLPVNWLKDMWRPDSFFKNAKKVTFQDMTIPNHYVWLYQDKTILYMVKLTLILSCAMNFQRYPHDEQVCGMKIESLSHTTDDLVFVWDPLVPLVVDKIELPQLDLVSNETADCTQVYSTGNFTCLQVLFTFKRRLGYYLFHTYIPTCLIVIMSWISFWIRPEAVPARVTLGVTSLLTLSTQHANSQKALPPVSYIKAIDMFMSSCTIFVFCSLMEYAMVNVVMGDVIDGDESALKRGMKSIFMATRLISSKQTTARETSVAVPVSCSHSHLQLPLPSQHVTTSAVPQQHAVQLHNQRLNHRTTQGQRTQSAVSLNAIVPDVTTGTSSGTTSPSQAPLNATLTSSGAALLNTKCENGKQGPSANSVTPVTQSAEANVAHIYPPTHPPYCRAPAAPPSLSLQQIRRDRAIFIDRVSRVVFPASFALLNVIYWSIFIEW